MEVQNSQSAQPAEAELGTILEKAMGEVFEIMLGIKLGPAATGTVLRHPDLTALIGLAGDLSGVITLSCSAASAAHMASSMLGAAIEEVDDDVRDALGEICNMIAGNFRAKIPGQASSCSLSIPTVISGEDYELHALAPNQHVELWVPYEGTVISLGLYLERK